MITITITNGKDSLIGKTDEGKVAFLRGQHNAHVGEAFFAEVIREEERFLVVSLGEKIEPPVFDSKEKEDVVSSCGDYVVIRCETRRNIRNTFGGGMGGFAEGVNLSAYPYLYGDKDCREPLNYRRHGDRHEFYAVRSTGRAAERRRVQEARAAAETAAIAASEKAAEEKAAAFKEWLNNHSYWVYWKKEAEIKEMFYSSPDELEEEYEKFVKGVTKEFVELFKENPNEDQLRVFLNCKVDLKHVPVPAEGGFWAWRKAARIWIMNQIKEF